MAKKAERQAAERGRGAGRRRGRRAHRREGRLRSRSARSCPAPASSRTFEFRVADCKGFVTVGEYEDGRPGEIFVRVSKQGSTLAGIMDAFAISVSHGLQYGVPLRSFVEAFTGMRFEPAGMTDDPDIRIANSPDGLPLPQAGGRVPRPTRSGPSSASSPPPSACSPRCPASRRPSSRPAQGTTCRRRPAVDRVGLARSCPTDRSSRAPAPAPAAGPVSATATPRMCMQCGVQMQRAGSCHACPSCGTTSGCS